MYNRGSTVIYCSSASLSSTLCALQIDGAYLLSVNDDAEHNFVIDTLANVDTGQVK